MVSSDRQGRIVDLLTRSVGPISSNELAARFSVSVSTIERDLAAIRRSGVQIESREGRGGGVFINRSEPKVNGPSVRQGGVAHFVGRRPELAALVSARNGLRDTGLRAVLISGDSGVGKTRLVSEFARICEAGGMQVLRSQASSGFTAPPLWPWSTVIQALSSASDSDRGALGDEATALGAALLPEESRSDAAGLNPQGLQFQLFNRVGRFLDARITTPTLIALDDLQEADSSTLALLEFLVIARLSAPVLLVGVYTNAGVTRKSPLSRTLGALARVDSLVRVQVRPLAREEVEELLRAEFQSEPDAATADQVWSLSEGNPFFLREIVKHLNSNPDSATGLMPEGVRDVIGRRLDGLPRGCVDVLRVAALAGRTFDTGLVADAMTRVKSGDGAYTDVTVTLELLDAAVEAGLLERSLGGDACTFTHGLIHEVVLQEISTAEAVSWHAVLGLELERRVQPTDPQHATELARHFMAASPALGPEKAARYSMVAGMQAMSAFAFADAAIHYEAVLRLPHDLLGADKVNEARGRLGQALAFSTPRGEKQRAVEVIGESIDYYLETEQIRNAVELALTEVMPIAAGAEMEEPATRISELIAKVIKRVETGSLDHARLLARQSTVLSIERTDGYEEARRSAEEALVLATRHSDARLRLVAERGLAALDFRSGRADTEYPARCRRLAAEAQAIGDVDSELRFRFYMTSVLMSMGSLPEAGRESRAFLQRAEEYREPSNLQQALGMAANLAVRRGEWDEARTLASRNLRVAGQNGWALGALTAVRAATGEASEIRELVELIADGVGSVPRPVRVTAAVLLLCNAGDEERVGLVEAATRLLDVREGVGHSSMDRVELPALYASVAIASRDAERASRAYEAMVGQQGFVLQAVGIHPERLLALLAAVIGHRADAGRHLNAALRYYLENACLPETAYALADAGGLGLPVVIEGKRMRPKEALAKARSIALQLGMKSLLRRLDSPTASGPGPDTGLTDREMEILRLIATGRSNRAIAEKLFISENTVTRHITNIYSKIGVQGRAEATAYAFQAGLVEA